MRKTKALYGAAAREALIEGVNKVFNAVAPTMGARGRNVIYKKYGMPIVTNDGVSIAREIMPEDDFESLGAGMVKQASEETNYVAGDGTSATIVLTKHMIDKGTAIMKDTGYNPMVLRREMEVGLAKVVAAIKEKAVMVTDLTEVARISVEDEKLATMIAGIVQDVGEEGSIVVEETHGQNVRCETVKGYTCNTGYVSPYMQTNSRGEAILENCAVLVTDRYMTLNTDLFQAMSDLNKKGVQNLFVIAENVEGELLQTIIANKQKGSMNIVAVKKLETSQELEDIAILTGATAITKDKGIKAILAGHAGLAERVVVTKDRTILVAKDNPELLTARIDEVKNQIEAEDQEKYGEIEVLKRRLARLTSGVARIKVGSNTEAEQAYLKMKIDDAVAACIAAMQEGVVAGGGTTLRDLAILLDGEIPGEQVLKTAMWQPYFQILDNAGISCAADYQNYNVLTGEVIEDMMAAGIVDPAKVVRCALENAVSTAKTLLTTECAIVELPEESVQIVRN